VVQLTQQTRLLLHANSIHHSHHLSFHAVVNAVSQHLVLASGAVLVTPDGKWPAPDQEDALEDALEKCRIKRWELYKVDNSSSAAAPLTVPEGPMKTIEPEVV
jgi:2C-methyl-D-erythritol 2,4-cyclodiphosphate synthase